MKIKRGYEFIEQEEKGSVDSTLINVLDALQNQRITMETAYKELDTYLGEQMSQQDKLTQSYMSNEMNSLRGIIRKQKVEIAILEGTLPHER